MARGRGEPDVLARAALDFIVSYVGAQTGLIYRYSEAVDQLFLVGSYAHRDREGDFSAFKLGEGLIGQAAFEGQPGEPLLFGPAPTSFGDVSVRVEPGAGAAGALRVSWDAAWHDAAPVIEVRPATGEPVVAAPGVTGVELQGEPAA